jgi:LacI family transcriptional regulator
LAAIKDIAKLAGCATSTVSRVLNNRDAVAPATRQRVQDAIQQLDYRPSLTAQGLRAKQQRLIGLAVPSGISGAFAQIVQCALNATYKHGYNLLLANTDEDPDREEYFISDFLRWNISGIIFSRVSDDSKILKKLVRRNIPVVVIDRALEHENVSNVILDNPAAGYMAGKHLLGLGHRRIGCITGPANIALCRERLSGFRRALEEEAVPLDESHIVQGDFRIESGTTGMRELTERGIACTAAWAMNDWMALGAMRFLQQRGLRVPDDFSIAGMDDTEIAVVSSPPLTSVHYPFDELVEKAVELILSQIGGRKCRTEIVVLAPRVEIRGSTAVCPKDHGNE